MQIPTHRPSNGCSTLRPGALLLAVYAPFGSDPVLTNYPGTSPQTPAQHPLVRYLRSVARSGVDVVALLDLFDQETSLVTVRAGDPEDVTIVGQSKQDMMDPLTLSTFLQRAHAAFPRDHVVLTLEGHGAGFLPDLDLTKMTFDAITDNGDVSWALGAGMLQPREPDGETPLITTGAPVLPIVSPTSPTNHEALSTWAIAEALQMAQEAGVPRISVIHFNNCFNMSAEVLHTAAPYAEYATGYCNYNFFTAGEAYPLVFERLAGVGSASSEDLAKWFAAANHLVLAEAGHEPTVAGTVALERMPFIAEKVDDLADALLAALRGATAAQRPATVEKIRQAIIAAQQYDSRPDYILETPDELTDLDSFASELLKFDFAPYKVAAAADALRGALAGIKQYGDVGTPWMAPGDLWDFSSKNLAMNIFLPDPLLKGLWDWRSQYYLDVNPDPTKPQVQRHVIEFLKVTDWVEFLIEYHKDAPFVGLLPAMIPEFPVLRSKFNARFPGRPVITDRGPEGGAR